MDRSPREEEERWDFALEVQYRKKHMLQMNSRLQSGLNTSTDHNNHYSARITCFCDSKSLARLEFHLLFTNLRFVQSAVSKTTTLTQPPCWTHELPLLQLERHTNKGSLSQSYIYTYCPELNGHNQSRYQSHSWTTPVLLIWQSPESPHDPLRSSNQYPPPPPLST